MLNTYKVEHFQDEESILYLPSGFRTGEDTIATYRDTRNATTICHM